MADHKYVTWHDVPKTKQNLYAVLFGYLYVEHDGHIYEFIRSEEDYRRGHKMQIILSDINNGDWLFASWYELLHSPDYSIVRKEA